MRVIAAIPQTFRKGLIEKLSFLWQRKFRKVTMLQSSFDKPFLRKKRFVVDDGFSDGTEEVAKAAGVHLIRHEKNKGTGAAVRAVR